MEIKTYKVINVQEIKDEIVCETFFAFVDPLYNDSYNEIYPFEWLEYLEGNREYYETNWARRVKLSQKDIQMTAEEAVKHLQNWLKEKCITKDDDLLVNIWW